MAINGQPVDFLKKLFFVLTGKNLLPPAYNLVVVPDLSPTRLATVAEFASKGAKQGSIDTLFQNITKETINQGYEKLKSRRARGKIVYSVGRQ